MSAELMKSKFVRCTVVPLWQRLSLKLLHELLSIFSCVLTLVHMPFRFFQLCLIIGFLALLDYVSRAHEIEIRPSSVRPSVCGIDYL